MRSFASSECGKPRAWPNSWAATRDRIAAGTSAESVLRRSASVITAAWTTPSPLQLSAVAPICPESRSVSSQCTAMLAESGFEISRSATPDPLASQTCKAARASARSAGFHPGSVLSATQRHGQLGAIRASASAPNRYGRAWNRGRPGCPHGRAGGEWPGAPSCRAPASRVATAGAIAGMSVRACGCRRAEHRGRRPGRAPAPLAAAADASGARRR